MIATGIIGGWIRTGADRRIHRRLVVKSPWGTANSGAAAGCGADVCKSKCAPGDAAADWTPMFFGCSGMIAAKLSM
jgi:hypothetical protein